MARRFVTAEDIDGLVSQGRSRLEVDEQTTVTDLARERAQDRGIAIISAEAGVRSLAATGATAAPKPVTAPVAGESPAPPGAPPPNPFVGVSTEEDPLRVGRWSRARVHDWYAEHPWIVGCNYAPAYASNQLEMWQADTFDLAAITAELDLARSLGFTTLRVFLHDLLWSDPSALLDRVDRFLDACRQRRIAPMLVFFDGVWSNYSHLGDQAAPIPGIHNSRWLQSPISKAVVDPDQWPRLEDYVCGVMERFASDERVLLWDLYNEPGNEGLITNALPLLDASFRWARSLDVSQPLTSGIWQFTPAFAELNRYQLLASDLLSFHHYGPVADLQWLLRSMEPLGRPILCTEYMARPLESTFDPHLRVLRDRKVGAVNWGLVAGRSQTIHAWDSPRDAPEPSRWFHDIFRSDGTPFDPAEVAFIRATTGA